MYITKVSGHRQATMAIGKSLKRLLPDAEVMSINGFGYTYPILEKVVNKAYMGVIKSTPKVWDYIYDNPSVVKRSTHIKNFLHKTSHKKLQALFDKFKPDTVVCAQAFPCGMVADYKRFNNLDLTLIGVLTDFSPHSFWINEGVDHYIVPSEETRDRFLKKGVPAETIKVYGIPIRAKFAEKLDKAQIAAKLGFDPDVPTILIMGGGQGLGPIRKVVKSLIKIKQNIQLIVIAGTNRKLNEWLKKVPKKTTKKIVFYDYANNVDELMTLATMIITKPGGMTTAESLAKGLPMVIVNPIPGQEMRNTDFLLQNGIAVRIDKTHDISEEVDLLLKSPAKLAAMRDAALANGRPYSADDIARLIINSDPRVCQAATR